MICIILYIQWCFYICYYYKIIRIKSTGIYIYHCIVSLLFLFILFLYVMDCTAFGMSWIPLWSSSFVIFFKVLPICLASSWFVDLTTVFASSPYRHFTGVASFVSLCLPLSICSIVSKLFNSCKLLMMDIWALCTSTLFSQVNICSLSIIVFLSLWVNSYDLC